MLVTERYSTAIHSSNLKSRPETTFSDSDVLAAMGLAGRHHPLAVVLTRMLAGDRSAAHRVTEVLADMAFKRARTYHIALQQVEATDLARAVIAWYRHGTCQPCGGHGYRLITGTRTLSDDIMCSHCAGTGKIAFEGQFPADRRELAKWLAGQVDRAQSIAGPAAMRLLAPRFEVGG